MLTKKERPIRELILKNKKNRTNLFKTYPKQEQGFVLLSFNKSIQKDILNHLTDQEILAIIKFLDLDGTVDLLQQVPKEREKRIVKKLEEDIRQKITYLLKFDPESAAGMMNIDYIEIDENDTPNHIHKLLKKHEDSTGKIPNILVLKQGIPIGELPLSRLLHHKETESIKKHVKKTPIVYYKSDINSILDILKQHPHDKLIVIDDDSSILGIIYAHDLIKKIREENYAGIKSFAGVKKEEEVNDHFLQKFKHRYAWLVLNLATAFLAAATVGLFKETIAKYVLLAVYMPIVAGMGGNAGTQTLAVFVRGIALKEIELATAKKAILYEVLAGLGNGILNGIIAALIAIFWNQSPILGVVIGVAMVVNLMVAGFFGALIPLLMKRLGKDPASSATIFITTATDVLGFLVFLGLATILL